MVEFSDKVERWRSAVSNELNRARMPLPVDLVLSVIHTESRGTPGLVNKKSGASGLMQVMPGTLDWYNKQTGSNIPLSALRSKAGATEQIRTGVWVLGQFWRSAYRYLREKRQLKEIPTVELAKLADLFYVAGPGATRKKADKVHVPFYDAIAARFPGWNALPHPKNVFSKLDGVTWDLASISKWLEGAVTGSRKVRSGAILTVAAILFVYWFMLRKKEDE
jgi:hypothetical protein